MTNDEMLEPRYQELATFMRAPYRPDLDGVEIALYGVPYDGGVTNRPGARHGPPGDPQPVVAHAHDQPRHPGQPLRALLGG